MRCALYLRASRIQKTKVVESLTLSQQEATCRAYAAQQGWEVSDVYTDASKSGYARLYRRTSLQQMLDGAKTKRFGVVIVYAIDRLARKMADAYRVADDLERLGVKVRSATEQVEYETDDGALSFALRAIVAESQSRRHGRKMKDLRAAEAAQGRIVGPVPFGLTRDGTPAHGADAVQLAARLYATGQVSYQDVAHELTAAGHRYAGRAFGAHDVKRILHNPIYAGVIVCDGRRTPAAFPPLIDPALWAEVEAQQQRRRPDRPIRATVRTADDALLAGIGRCASCGAKLHYQHDRRRGYRYYYCAARRDGGDCQAPYGHADALDTALTDWLTRISVTPAAWVEAALALRQTQPAPRAAVSRAALDERLRRLARAYADGAYTDSEYATQRAALLAQLRETPAPVERPVPVDALRTALADWPALVEAMTTRERRAVITALISEAHTAGNRLTALRPTRAAAPLIEAMHGYAARVSTHTAQPGIPALLAA